MRKIPSTCLVTAIIAALLTCSACMAHRESKSGCTVSSRTDFPTDIVGDSITALLRGAKDVSVTLHDDGTTITRKHIGKTCRALLRFIMANPANYSSDSTVYGKLIPNLSITFSHKRLKCTAAFDFGLRKWALYDSAGNLISRFDMASGNDMVRFALMLFPDNNTLISYLNNN